MFRFMFFLIISVISSFAFSQTFSLSATTSSTGIYSISYSHSGIGVTLIDELQPDNSWRNIGGGGTSGSINVTKTQSGVYSYRSRTCTGSCSLPSAIKTITVTLVPVTPTLSVSGVENTASNIDTNGSFSFSWNAVSNADAYALEQNGGTVYYNTGTSHSIANLGYGTYTYRVKACRDSATVCSALSNSITVTIQYPKPTLPSGVTFSGVENTSTNTDTNGSFSVSWGDSTGAEAYSLEQNGNPVYWGAGKTYNASLSPGSYTFRVKGCRDSATNCSDLTAAQTVTVVAPTTSSSSKSSSSIAITSSSRSSSSIAVTSSSRSSSSIALISSSRSSSSVAVTSSSRSSSSAALTSSSRSSSSSSSSVPAAQTTTTTYVYDDLGRIKTVTHPNAVKNTYTYDSADNRTKKESTAN